MRHLPAALCGVLLTVGITVVRASIQVTLFSDIHYDPQYGTATAFGKCSTSASSVWGVAGCDASPQLTQRLLDDMSAQNTSFLFFGGDWQRHGFSSSGLAPAALFMDLAERFRNVTVDGSLGDVAFAGSLGNTDVVPDNYFSWESAASEEQLAYRVQAMETVGLLNATEAGVMARCGYYTHEMETLNAIVLHTLLWAYRLEPPLASSVEDPCGQFAFLKAELAKARAAGKRSVIVGHIPPGLNSYNVLSAGFTVPENDMFWKPLYQTAYDVIISDYKDVVAVQLFGHIHRFVLHAFPANDAPSVNLPAISPVFGNAPSYLFANFSNDGWVLEDLQMRYLTPDGELHTGLKASAALKTSAQLGSLTSLRSSIKALATDDEAWEMFLSMHCGGETRLMFFPGGKCDTFCRQVLVCSMLENVHENIQSCVADLSAKPVNTTRPWRTALTFICAVFTLGVAVLLVLMSRSGQTELSVANFGRVEWWKSLLRKHEAPQVVVVEHELLIRPATH